MADDVPRLPDGSIDYDELAKRAMGGAAAAAKPSASSSSSSNNTRTNTSNYTSYTPQPRDAYGPYLAGDLINRTIALDAKTRVDPYTGQRYSAGNDGTWREAGFLNREDTASLRQSGAMAPTGQQLGAQTTGLPGLSANPGLRAGAGAAGMVGNVGPQDVPQLASLQGMRIPGLGFNADQYKPMDVSRVNLNSVPLGAPVSRTGYGYDFGGGPHHLDNTRTTGVPEIQTPMPNFQVPNGYQPGPSGFSIPAANGQGGAFQAFAMPFGVQNPTFSALSQSAPAQIQPNTAGTAGGGAAATGPAVRTSPEPVGGSMTKALGVGLPDYTARGGPSAAGGASVAGLPAASVAAVQATWPAELVPQALALMKRESSGDPTADNSKGYQGGPLNNDPKYGNKPGSAGYNSIDYGLFGINDKAHFERLGLTPESAKDPMTNAAAAYKIYQSAGGWSPWTGNGTIALPPPIGGAGAAAQTGTPTRTSPVGQDMSKVLGIRLPDYNARGTGPALDTALKGGGTGWGGAQELYSPLGPGETKPGGMLSPGGAGALWQNGSQTADIRNGASGFGFNADTILKDYGRSGVSNDAATRSWAALALMNQNNEAQKLGMSPLDAYIAMNSPSSSNFGAPVGATATASQGGGQGGAGNAGYQDSTIGFPWDDDRNGEGGISRFARGGTVDTEGMQLPLGGGAATPAAVAPIQTTDLSQQMAQPVYNPAQQQQQTQQQALQQPAPAYLDSTAQAAAPSNSEGAIAPIQNGAQSTTNTAQNTAAPQITQAPNDQFMLNTAGNDQSGVLQPFQDALTRLGVIQRQRDADAGRYKAAGLSSPMGIDTIGDLNVNQLPPGIFYDPSGMIKNRVGEITGLQSQLAGLGNPGSIEELTGKQVPLQNLQSLFGNMNNMQQQLAAYGQVGNSQDYYQQLMGIDPQLARYNEAMGIQSKLAGLGNVGDPSQYNQQLGPLETQLRQYQAAIDAQIKLAGLGNVQDPTEIGTQIAQLQQKMSPYQSVLDLINKRAVLAAPLEGHRDYNADYANMVNMQAMHDALSQGAVPDPGYGTTGGGQHTTTQEGGGGPAVPQQGMYDQNGRWWNATDVDAELGRATQQYNQWQELQNLSNTIAGLDPNHAAADQMGTMGAEMQRLQLLQQNAGSAFNERQSYQNQLADLAKQGISGDLYQGRAGVQSQYDTLAQQQKNAQAAQELQTQYQNQLAPFQGQDLNAIISSLMAQKGTLGQQLTDAQKAEELRSNLANLQGQTGGQTEAGVQSQLAQLQDALSRSRQVGTTTTTLQNLLAQGVPGAGKLPGFAGGGKVFAGGRGFGQQLPGRSDIQGYQPRAPWGESIYQLAARRAGGKPYAAGGSMTTPEEIVGIGRYSGKPYFRVGENGMAERLTVQPLHQPIGGRR